VALCSSSPNIRSPIHLDGGFANHCLVHDSIPPIDFLGLLAHHRHRHGARTPSRSRFLIAVRLKSCGTRATPAPRTARPHAL